MAKNTIKITDKFVWKVLTFEQAHALIMLGLFPVYALQDGKLEELIGDLEHLESFYSNDKVSLVIEVGYTDYQVVEELKSLLKSHDYTYQYSDDNRAYKRGHESLKRISELSKEVSREDFVKWWNREAPSILQFTK